MPPVDARSSLDSQILGKPFSFGKKKKKRKCSDKECDALLKLSVNIALFTIMIPG